jgi:hypothetical protein
VPGCKGGVLEFRNACNKSASLKKRFAFLTEEQLDSFTADIEKRPTLAPARGVAVFFSLQLQLMATLTSRVGRLDL